MNLSPPPPPNDPMNNDHNHKPSLCLPEDPSEPTHFMPGYHGWLMHVLGRPNKSRNPVTCQYSREDDPVYLGSGGIVPGWRVTVRAPGFVYIFRGVQRMAGDMEACERVCRDLLELLVGSGGAELVTPNHHTPRPVYNPGEAFHSDEPRMGHLLRLLWKRWHFELDRGLRDTEDPLSIIVSESLGIDKEAGPETAGHRRQSTHVNLRAMTRRESIVDAVKLFTATVSTQDLHPQSSPPQPSYALLYRATIQWKGWRTAGGPYRKAEMALEHAAILHRHHLTAGQEWRSLAAYEEELVAMGVCIGKLASWADPEDFEGDRRHSLTDQERLEDATALRLKATQDRIRSVRKSFHHHHHHRVCEHNDPTMSSGISSYLYEQIIQGAVNNMHEADGELGSAVKKVPVQWPLPLQRPLELESESRRFARMFCGRCGFVRASDAKPTAPACKCRGSSGDRAGAGNTFTNDKCSLM